MPFAVLARLCTLMSSTVRPKLDCDSVVAAEGLVDAAAEGIVEARPFSGSRPRVESARWLLFKGGPERPVGSGEALFSYVLMVELPSRA